MNLCRRLQPKKSETAQEQSLNTTMTVVTIIFSLITRTHVSAFLKAAALKTHSLTVFQTATIHMTILRKHFQIRSSAKQATRDFSTTALSSRFLLSRFHLISNMLLFQRANLSRSQTESMRQFIKRQS